MTTTLKAMNALGELIGFQGDDPTTATQYKALKPLDEQSSVYKGDAPTWTQITAKIKEIEDAEAKAKTDKVSAYRKVSMTDDEIRAIDPTLEEYL